MGPFKARPTVYRGTLMRSRLEARFARYLDATGVAWIYEPRAYGGTEGDYLPDFQVIERGHSVFIELKPPMDPETIENADKLERAMERMEIIWESEPAASLMLVTGNHAIWAAGDDRRWVTTPYPWPSRG